MKPIDLMQNEMAKTLAAKGKVSLALSGGSSPVDLYRLLSSVEFDWARVSITLIDDRLVPADHPDSNQWLIAKTLRQNNAADAVFIPLEDWPDNEIADIAVLGMGSDGHFASLFPSMLDQSQAFDPAAHPAIIRTPPQGIPKHPRITMNLAMIRAIPCRILLVVGAEKQALLSAARSTTDLPISRLLEHDGTHIFTESV
ncbi:6-phosphogluconolactonase [Alphaproteobacteria bacterium]|nr:6-phosphogluconolactonase [Alphaproteobacteria bacterium]